MVSKKKESTTSVAFGSPLVDYADGIATFYVAPHLRKTIPVRIDGDIVSTSTDFGFNGEEDDPNLGDDPNKKDPEVKDPPPKKTNPRKSPTLMDIKLVSNTIVYDAAGNPSATVVFKIRNSSGEPVVGVKALVTKR